MPLPSASVAEQVEEAMARLVRREPFHTVREGTGGRWVDVRWIPLPDGRMLVLHRDISTLKQRELELQHAREALELEGERLRAMLDNLPDGAALYAANGDILHLNSACYELNRFPRDAFAKISNLREGLRWQIEHGQAPLTHASIEEELDARMAVFHNGEYHRHERLRYGRYLDVRWIPLPDGRRLVLHRDVTELRQREIELQAMNDVADRERATLQAVLANLTDGVALVEADCSFVVVNRALQEINGFPAEEFARFRGMLDFWRWLFEHGAWQRQCPTLEEDLERTREQFVLAIRSDPELRPADGPWVPRETQLRPNSRWVERAICRCRTDVAWWSIATSPSSSNASWNLPLRMPRQSAGVR